MNRWLASVALGVIFGGRVTVGCASKPDTNLAGFAGATATAGTSASDHVCDRGDTRACIGPGACRGGQECRADGTGWTSCDCAQIGAGGSDGEAGAAEMGGAQSNGGMPAGGTMSQAGQSATAGSGGAQGCSLTLGNSVKQATISDFSGATPLKNVAVVNGGSWASDTDATGTIAMTTEANPQLGAGTFLHFVGANHIGWGGDVAVMFIDVTTPLDASLYSGVAFTIAGSINGGALYAKLQNADSLVLGCGCDPGVNAAPQQACYGGYIAQALVGVGQTKNQLPWAVFEPGPSGYHARNSIDQKQLLNLALVVQNLDGLVSWDLWISDVHFY